MSRKKKRLTRYTDEQEYPSLKAQQAERRRFLTGTVAVLGGGALAACTRGLSPWSQQHQNNNQQVDGGIELPSYFQIRLPADPADEAVYLLDGGYARFYAVATTYHQDCADFAEDQKAALVTLLASNLSGRTFDELNLASNLPGVEADLCDALDEAYNVDVGESGSGWFESVVLSFTLLEAGALLGGVAPEPSYP